MEFVFWGIVFLVILLSLAGLFGWDVAAAVADVVSEIDFGGDD